MATIFCSTCFSVVYLPLTLFIMDWMRITYIVHTQWCVAYVYYQNMSENSIAKCFDNAKNKIRSSYSYLYSHFVAIFIKLICVRKLCVRFAITMIWIDFFLVGRGKEANGKIDNNTLTPTVK